ncbi:DUF2742 domain-containing protein [Jongsikchunia kroppenstedtii]|uniref:DUF2742 domain-containing protein n=1 Tax=Jongsikchunia kroppenstedtii TaxID=1121721 RepID=UPI000362920E|nr:DUF2742 domain-containing protein [Jongsikchunia kroppenstedtii]
MIEEPIRWNPVAAFVRRRVLSVAPIAGSVEWIELLDDDPAKLSGLIVAGSWWALETELAQRDQREWALKQTALDVAAQQDWSAVAKRLRDRDEFYESHPHLRRKAA